MQATSLSEIKSKDEEKSQPTERKPHVRMIDEPVNFQKGQNIINLWLWQEKKVLSKITVSDRLQKS